MANRLNGKDLKQLFGTRVIKTDDFLNWPKPKDSLETDLQSENGINKDLADRKLAAREFQLPVYLVADGPADFFNKYDGLFTELTTGDLHELYLEDHDKIYHLYYDSQQPVQKLTKIQAGKVGIKFIIVFKETNPFDNITLVFLVDDQDRFLTA